jgi:anti-sigma B factor antagonist
MAMPQDFGTSVEQRGDVCVFFRSDETLIRLAGEVDLALAEALAFVAEEATERASPIRVDVSQVRFIDSTGLSLIGRVAAVELRAGRRVRVEGADRRLRDLLRISGLSPVLDLDRFPSSAVLKL